MAASAPASPERAPLRDSVIAAVDELVRTRGWAATTMADVARAAGVSRQTLYNEFGARGALVEAYVEREIQTLVTEIGEAVRSHPDDAHLALRSAFELFLKLASDEPVVQIIVADAETGELTRLLTGIGQQLAGESVATLITEVWTQVTPADANLLADSLVRLAISHALAPTEDFGVIAEGVGRLLSPFVDVILAPDA